MTKCLILRRFVRKPQGILGRLHMVTLYKILLSKEQLKTLDKKYLVLLLGSAKLYNEISIGMRHFLFTINGLRLGDNDAERSSRIALIAYALRMLAGHLHEASNFIKKTVHIRELKGGEPSSLITRLESRVKEFKIYFSRSNIISDIRQKMSFHTDIETLVKVFTATNDVFTLEFFCDMAALKKADFSQHLFAGSDMLAVGSIMHLPSSKEHQAPFQSHITEVTRLAISAMEILSITTLVVIEAHFDSDSIKGDSIALGNVPLLSEIRVPYFFEYTAGADIPREANTSK